MHPYKRSVLLFMYSFYDFRCKINGKISVTARRIDKNRRVWVKGWIFRNMILTITGGEREKIVGHAGRSPIIVWIVKSSEAEIRKESDS